MEKRGGNIIFALEKKDEGVEWQKQPVESKKVNGGMKRQKHTSIIQKKGNGGMERAETHLCNPEKGKRRDEKDRNAPL